MQEPIKPISAREMHKYVWGFVGVFFLIVGSYPIAFWRVSQHEKFAGFHVKSLTLDRKIKQPANQAVALQQPANNFIGETATINAPFVAGQPANSIEIMSSSSNKNAIAQPEVAVNPSDRVQLRALNQKLYDQIAKNWQPGQRFEQGLVYRVSVTGEGAIASFQPVNQAASNLLQQTPLPNLLPSSISRNTPVVDFRVVFTSLGILEVSPWDGFGN